MSDSLGKFLGALQAAGLSLNSEGARDALWLALRIAERQSAAGVTLGEARGAAIKSPLVRADGRESDAGAAADFSKGMSGTEETYDPAVPVRRIRLASPPSLPGSRALGRAFHPLRREASSPAGYTIDLDETIRRAAEEDLWSPVLRPTSECWLSLALVVERSLSMAVFQSTVRELRRALRWSGAFRDLRVWWLDAEGSEAKVYARSRDAAKGTGARRLLEVPGSGRRSLVLMLSDCVSDGWYDGRILSVLASWSRSAPVALLQVLPERMWSRTVLGEGVRVRLRSSAEIQTNRHLRWIPELPDPWSSASGGFLLPTASLEVASLRTLARLIAGEGSRWMTGFLFDLKEQQVLGPPPSEPPVFEAAERVRRFFALSSTQAVRLAALLAASPVLSLGVLRLLRRELLAEAGPVHEAEVLLGGILRVCGAEGAGPLDPEGVQIEFLEGVRPLLLDNASAGDVLQVLERAVRLAESPGLDTSTFELLLADPEAAAGALDPKASPFARQAAEVFTRLGGHYARAVRGHLKRGDIEETPARKHGDRRRDREPSDAEAKRWKDKESAGPTKVFISYSHDSLRHSQRVLELANQLRKHGVDAVLDQYEAPPPQGWPRWYEEQLWEENSDFVLVICTENYLNRLEGRVPANQGLGVFWEGSPIYSYLYDQKSNGRFVPILFDRREEAYIPRPLKASTSYRLEAFDFTDSGYEALSRELTGQRAFEKAALGEVVELHRTPALSGKAQDDLTVRPPVGRRDVHSTFPVPEAPTEEDSLLEELKRLPAAWFDELVFRFDTNSAMAGKHVPQAIRALDLLAVVRTIDDGPVRLQAEIQRLKRGRDHIFISYSQRDKKFMNELQAHLKPFLRSGVVTAWSDQQIASGAQWFQEIQTALSKASVAVLLVSPDFLASDFIQEREFGLLLKEAESRGLKILWIPVRAAAFKETPLRNYQAASPPDRPLTQMNKADRDEAWVRICKEITRDANLWFGEENLVGQAIRDAPNEDDVIRDQVFLSYSHEDEKFLKELLRHLRPFLRSGAVTAWSDWQMASGAQWFREIEEALARASVVVLLVSPVFLASDFIHEHQLGPLLKEAESGRVRILWIPIRPSTFEEAPLAKYQAVSPPNQPLAQMGKADRDKAWVRICKEIKRATTS